MITPERLIAHEAGTLSRHQRAELENELARDAEALRLFVAQRQMDEALRAVFGSAEGRATLKKSILEVVADRNRDAVKENILRSVSVRAAQAEKIPGSRWNPALWRTTVLGGLAAAACVVLALWLWPSRGSGIARVVVTAGRVSVERHGGTQPAGPGFALKIGDTLDVAAQAAIEYHDGTRLMFVAGSRATLTTGSAGGKRIEFSLGTLQARVSKQPAHAPMMIVTPQATVTVVGTAFMLEAEPARTRLDVQEGLVRITREGGAESVEVAAGQSAVFLPDAIQPPAPAPGDTRGFGSGIVNGKRRAFLWPFASDSPWNRPLGDGARFEPIRSPHFDAHAPLSNVVTGRPIFMEVQNFPMRRVLVDGKPAFRVRFADRWQAGFAANWPLIIIIDPARNSVAELRGADRLPSGDLTAQALRSGALDGSGVAPNFPGLADYGGSALGGVIRFGELTRGIPHALAVGVRKDALGGNLQLGSLLAIPPAVDLSRLGVGESGMELARALQDYGACVTEVTREPFTLFAWYENIPPDFARTVAALLPHLQVVTNNTPETPGGGGTPRRPPAPDIEK